RAQPALGRAPAPERRRGRPRVLAEAGHRDRAVALVADRPAAQVREALQEGSGRHARGSRRRDPAAAARHVSVVTVAIPVLNGARYLDEVLAAVRAQRIDRELEILIVDSGSTDGSLEIARRHGAVVHEIERSEFSHGGTRNRMMGLARGDHVAFLTQDATPADEHWLAALLEGFEQADDVAAVFGPHDARPDARHMIKSEMERFFAGWGNGATEVEVLRLDRSPEGIEAYRSFPGQLSFLSDVNCAIARWAWEQVPYRE